jgi:hypothetical protein
MILKESSFQLFAGTEREKDEWIGQIGRAIVKNSGMYVSEPDEENSDDEEDN